MVPVYFCLTSLHVFGVVLAGWASNSMYAMLGTLRAIAQTISYELPLVLIVLGLCFQAKTFSFLEFGVVGGHGISFLWADLPLFCVWVILSVAELHRAPFDLPEAERELVSGYNTDYGAVGFILLFISEYANVVFVGQIIRILWLHSFLWFLKVVLGCLCRGFVLLLRAVFPRARYNGLIEVC